MRRGAGSLPRPVGVPPAVRGVPPPQELAGRGCVRTSLFDPLPNPRYLRARSHRRLKALLMAAEALLQAWSSGMARKAALNGSAWMGPS